MVYGLCFVCGYYTLLLLHLPRTKNTERQFKNALKLVEFIKKAVWYNISCIHYLIIHVIRKVFATNLVYQTIYWDIILIHDLIEKKLWNTAFLLKRQHYVRIRWMKQTRKQLLPEVDSSCLFIVAKAYKRDTSHNLLSFESFCKQQHKSLLFGMDCYL